MTAKSDWLSFPDAPRIVVHRPAPVPGAALGAGATRDRRDRIPALLPHRSEGGPGGHHRRRGRESVHRLGGGICVLNLGHRHPRLVAALEAQSKEIWHALELPTEARIHFLRELESVLPGHLRGHSRIFLSVTGGDAVETAVNIADHAQGKRGTVAFSGAYHGVHGGVVSLTSGRRYHSTSSFGGGAVVRVPYPDPYRPVLGADEGSAGTISYLEHLVNDLYSGIDSISSILVEPILGEGGYVVPPDDFLPSLREFCDRHSILLIVDEIQTGLGRTGKMWAVEHSKVTPDILCIAKTIGGGIPLAVVAYRADLVKELPRGFHLGTFRANALALAVGAETIRVLKDTHLVDHTRTRGEHLLSRFHSLADRHPAIGNVRGKGFMIGVEFVHDRASRLPWGDRAKAMRSALLARGVLMHTSGAWDQVLRFMSPLVIEDELLDRDSRRSRMPSRASTPPPSDRRRLPPMFRTSRPRPPTCIRPPSTRSRPPVVPDFPGRNLEDEDTD